MAAVLKPSDFGSCVAPRPVRRNTITRRTPRIEPHDAPVSQVLSELLLARWMAPQRARLPARMPLPPRLAQPDPTYPLEARALLDATFEHRAIDWGQVSAYAIQVLLNRR